LVQGSHCMTPRYLDAMIERSRANLGLETIDIYYLHNPESQLGAIGRDEFHRRIRAAFEFLEGAVAQGRIACYGAATWNGYRAKAGDASYLAIAGMVKLAADVGGDDHHFRVIQLPYNLAMPEALTLVNQEVNDGKKASALAAADANGLAVCASASLLQGQLTRGLPAIVAEALAGMESDAQRSLQFVRSTPGIKVALVGMSAPAHVAHNLATASRPPAPFDQLMKLFQPATA
jgi:aryl-alcohol dehydrogenase-like predicted oxidoreductase